MTDKTFITTKPPLKAVDNGDGTFSISILDINSAAILASILALRDAATLDDIEAAVEALRTASTLDTLEAAINAVLAGPLPIKFADSPALDAFGRNRMSEPQSLFNSKQIFDNAPIFWDDAEESGASTTSVHSVNGASSTMGVALNTAGKRTRQTFRRFNYETGKSIQIIMTGVFDGSGGGSGITRGIGYYDDNNGLFFQDDEGTIKVVRRTKASGSVVDNKTAQSSWNQDTMDGSGGSSNPSGVNIDWTKSQIFTIDFEWLGVGRVRYGLFLNGGIIYVHEETLANSIDTVYMSTPNLPLRYQIENDGTGAASTMVHTCSTVIAEGGSDDLGTSRYKSTEGTHINAATENIIYAVLGIRLKSAAIGGTVKLVAATLAEHAGTKNVEWILKFNPTVADTFTYTDETNSIVQTAKGGALNIVTGGIDITGGHFSTDKKGGSEGLTLDDVQRLGAKIDGTVDEIVLCARPIGGSSAIDIEGSLTWKELV